MNVHKVFLAAVLCAGVCLSGVQAQTIIGFKGIGGHIALVDPDNVNTTFGIGGVVDLGTFIPLLHFEANADYWSKSEGNFGAKASVRDIALGASTKYEFKTGNPAVSLFAGGGLAFHFLRGKVPVESVTIEGERIVASDTDTKIGIDALGGVNLNVSPKVDLVGTLKYRIVSDVNQVVLSAGALVHM